MKSIDELNREYLENRIILLYHKATRLYMINNSRRTNKNTLIDKAFESELHKLLSK